MDLDVPDQMPCLFPLCKIDSRPINTAPPPETRLLRFQLGPEQGTM